MEYFILIDKYCQVPTLAVAARQFPASSQLNGAKVIKSKQTVTVPLDSLFLVGSSYKCICSILE